MQNDPYRKDYRKPQGFSVREKKGNEHIHDEGNFMFLQAGGKPWVSFILPQNNDSGTPEPTRRWFALSDPRPLAVGDDILVDLQNGKSQKTQVIKKENRVVFVSPPLDSSPKLTGEVYKIIGVQSTEINTRYDLETSKGQSMFEKYEENMEQVKKEVAMEVLQQQGFKRKFRPGESPFKR